MKSLILLLTRLALIAAPSYSVYMLLEQGNVDLSDVQWWKENVTTLLLSVGAYFLLLMLTLNALINWKQTVLLASATAAVIAFYYDANSYKLVFNLPYFQGDNRENVVYAPYLLVLAVWFLNRLLKTRYKLKNQPKRRELD